MTLNINHANVSITSSNCKFGKFSGIGNVSTGIVKHKQTDFQQRKDFEF